MSDERAKKWIEESQKDSIRQAAGNQHIQAAQQAERAGDYATMEKEYAAAGEAFLKSAVEYRSSKSFKKAATNMCDAGDVFSELADASKAIEAYRQGADDLLSASAEHLMWGEDAETSKGTALAITACMIYIMIGKEADGFYKARSFTAENSSKIRLPAVVRLSQIPQMLESAIQSLDLNAFAEAENAAVTELKSGLAGAGSPEFSKYVDRGLDMVREILRGKLKVPKISSQLSIPIDLTFTEDFSVKISIKNSGEGDATNMKLEWHIDEGLNIVSGERNKTIPTVPAGETLDVSITLKSAEALGGTREFSVLVRGTYEDKLKTEYSLQAGPTILILKDYKESEKLLHDSSITEGRVSLLRASVEESEFEADPLIRIVDGLTASLTQARTDVEESNLDSAKARLQIVNDMIDQIDSLLGDDALIQKITEAKLAEKKAYALSKIVPSFDEVIALTTKQETKLETELPLALSEWDNSAEKKKRIHAAATVIRDISGKLKIKLTTPELQALDSTISDIQMEADKIVNDSYLVVGTRPESPEKIEMALVVARSIHSEITQLMEKKKSELE
ncbi:MAG: hypothetical protein KAR03_08600 [Candidatus Thorarchaeota archaeon]|nr:hypothetical protein [Candidatus Thorarchaeota archaeon]